MEEVLKEGWVLKKEGVQETFKKLYARVTASKLTMAVDEEPGTPPQITLLRTPACFQARKDVQCPGLPQEGQSFLEVVAPGRSHILQFDSGEERDAWYEATKVRQPPPAATPPPPAPWGQCIIEQVSVI